MERSEENEPKREVASREWDREDWYRLSKSKAFYSLTYALPCAIKTHSLAFAPPPLFSCLIQLAIPRPIDRSSIFSAGSSTAKPECLCFWTATGVFPFPAASWRRSRWSDCNSSRTCGSCRRCIPQIGLVRFAESGNSSCWSLRGIVCGGSWSPRTLGRWRWLQFLWGRWRRRSSNIPRCCVDAWLLDFDAGVVSADPQAGEAAVAGGEVVDVEVNLERLH